MLRLAILSDTHLSPKSSWSVENFCRAADGINADPPDLIIHTGDMSNDGAGDEKELVFAARCLERLTAPLVVVPGNHDIGQTPGEEIRQPMDRDRIDRYQSVFGADCWAVDLGPWRLLGLNAFLFGSGFEEERIQWAWLDHEIRSAGERPIGVISHKPFCMNENERAENSRTHIASSARLRLLPQLLDARTRFVVSGHLHQSRLRFFGGIAHIWLPSTRTYTTKPYPGSDLRLGYAELVLDDTNFNLDFVRPPDMQFGDGMTG